VRLNEQKRRNQNLAMERSSFSVFPYEIWKLDGSGERPATENVLRGWEKYATHLYDLEIDPDSGTLYVTNIKSNSVKIIPPDEPSSGSNIQDNELLRLLKTQVSP
jgi:hypothetical protein